MTFFCLVCWSVEKKITKEHMYTYKAPASTIFKAAHFFLAPCKLEPSIEKETAILHTCKYYYSILYDNTGVVLDTQTTVLRTHMTVLE